MNESKPQLKEKAKKPSCCLVSFNVTVAVLVNIFAIDEAAHDLRDASTDNFTLAVCNYFLVTIMAIFNLSIYCLSKRCLVRMSGSIEKVVIGLTIFAACLNL